MPSDQSMRRPRVFIGSSTEGLETANAVGANLDRDYEVTVWDQGVFRPGAFVLESLLAALDHTDFAILVFTADDIVSSRGTALAVTRDNVLFEHGLFVGRLGRECVYGVMSRQEQVKIASDLAGITFATFNEREDGDLQQAVRGAADSIRHAMRKTTENAQDAMRARLRCSLVYILRHAAMAKQYQDEKSFARVLSGFDCEDEGLKPNPNSIEDDPVWRNASVYACRFLSAMGLLVYNTNSEVRITKLGREIIEDTKTKEEFGVSYDTPLTALR